MSDDIDLTAATKAALDALLAAVHDPDACLADEDTCLEQHPVHPAYSVDGEYRTLYVHPAGAVKLIVEAVAPLLIEEGARRERHRCTRQRAILADLTEQSLELGTYDKTAPKER